MLSFHRALSRYWRLLAHYLRPHRLRMGLLAAILCVTIAAQAATPLLAGRFIDQATSGAALRDLVLLALASIGVALVGQSVAVAETYVAESVSWDAPMRCASTSPPMCCDLMPRSTRPRPRAS